MSFYDDASWLLIPSGIEEDVVFAQKPISGLGDLTFTRASDATYTDASGVVRRSPYNLLQQSETFDNAYWSTLDATVSANNFTSPTGTNSADAVVGSGTGTIVRLSSSTISGTLNASYTASCFLKKGTNNFALFQASITGATGVTFAYVDLVNGTSPQSDVSVQHYGNDWYRVSFTFTLGATFANIILRIFPTLSTSTTAFPSNADALNKSVLIWGAQLVEGTEALDYFPTTNRQDVPRIDFRNADGTLSSCGRLLLEPQRTNSIRNSSMVGAVAGSPGTLPTNYSEVLGGLTRSVVAVGTENGLPYVDLRFNGTATSTSVLIGIESPNAIAATVGQSWTESAYCKIISGTSNANSYALLFYERSSVGTYLTEGSTVIVPTSNLQRFAYTRTTTSATIAYVQPYIRFNLTNGATYDFTIRIAAPQMERGAYATTWVPTTTAAVTRLADAASKTGVSSLIGQTEGTLFLDFESGVLDSLDNVFGLNAGTTPSRIVLFKTSTNTIYAQIRDAGTFVVGIGTGTMASNTRYKCALAYKLNDVAFYVNGSLIGSDTSATIPACSVIAFDAGGLAPFQRPVNQAALFPTRLTNAQLAELTTL